MLRTSDLGPPDLAAASATRPRLTRRDKRLALAAATLGSFVVLLDSTVVSGALNLGGFRMALAAVAGLLALGGAIGLCGIGSPAVRWRRRAAPEDSGVSTPTGP